MPLHFSPLLKIFSKRVRRGGLIVITTLFMLLTICIGNAYADTTDSTVYGSGNYGDCNYGSCTISLTSEGATDLDIVPTAAGRCTVQNDTASVFTDSTAGYTVTMTTSTTNNALVGDAASLSAASGTAAAPGTLAMNTWGYRVDGVGGFGTGPASAQTNGDVPSVTFAGVPPSDQAGTTVAASSGPANPAVDTTVWYGLCANTTIPADTYTTTVLYTAVTN